MRRAIVVMVLGLTSMASYAQETAEPAPGAGQPTAPQVAPSLSAEELAVNSLIHSARTLLHSPAGTVGRAGRLVSIVEFAAQLASTNPQVNALEADIYEIQRKYKDASGALTRQLTWIPSDYVVGLSYLRVNMAASSTAKERLEFLKQAATQAEVDPYVRAVAHAEAARILLGQNDQKGAADEFREALKIDPLLPMALEGDLSLRPNATADEQARALLDLVKANPANADSSWRVGILLDSMGMYEPAITFFNQGWTLLRQREQQVDVMRAIQYFNALMDAKMSRRAIEAVYPLMKTMGQSPEIQTLLIEAYREVGDSARASELSTALQIQLAGREGQAAESPEISKEIAWFYVLNDVRLNTAIAYAKQAISQSPSGTDDSLELILGAAQLKTGSAKEGEARLRKLIEKDVYAAWFLAEYYFQEGDATKGKEAIVAGAKLSHRGRAFRRLAALAQRQNVEIPAAQGSKEVGAVLASFNMKYLEMGLSPEKFLVTVVRPVREVVGSMEPIELEVALGNSSEIDLPLGPDGLVNAAVSFKVSVTAGVSEEFTDLPMAILPAPRYLKGNQAVRMVIRIDVGAFEKFLVNHPFEVVTLNIEGVLDPVERGEVMRSSLPTVNIRRVGMARADVLGQFDRAKGDWAAQYNRALGYIVKDMQQGDVGARSLAAARVGSLLTVCANRQSQETVMPKQLLSVVKQPVLLSMTRELMKDPSATVRAQMVSSLDYCKVDGNLLKIIWPAITDNNALVRLRMAELLGIENIIPTQKAVTTRLLEDKDPLVAKMVKAFQKP